MDLDTAIGLIIFGVSTIATIFAWAIRTSTRLTTEMNTLTKRVDKHAEEEERELEQNSAAHKLIAAQLSDLNKSVARLEGILSRNGLKDK